MNVPTDNFDNDPSQKSCKSDMQRMMETMPPERLASMEQGLRGELKTMAEAQQPQSIREAAVIIPIKYFYELLALCGPEQHELRERVQEAASKIVAMP